MGVDAEMFVRIKGRNNWLDPSDELKTAYEMASTLGAHNFMITKSQSWSVGRDHHALAILRPIKDEDDADYHGLGAEFIGRAVWTQDGDPIVAAEDEQFIRVYLYTRYYGEEYARGDWPTIRSVAEWLEHRFPLGEVWYGGDSSGICAEHLHAERRAALNRFYLDSGRKSYVRYDRRGGLGFAGTSAPRCLVCEVATMYGVGGGRDYDFWACDGCGGKAVKHRDGRITVGHRHDDFSKLAHPETAAPQR